MITKNFNRSEFREIRLRISSRQRLNRLTHLLSEIIRTFRVVLLRLDICVYSRLVVTRIMRLTLGRFAWARITGPRFAIRTSAGGSAQNLMTHLRHLWCNFLKKMKNKA